MVAQDTFIGPSVDWFALSPHLTAFEEARYGKSISK